MIKTRADKANKDIFDNFIKALEQNQKTDGCRHNVMTAVVQTDVATWQTVFSELPVGTDSQGDNLGFNLHNAAKIHNVWIVPQVRVQQFYPAV